MSDADSINPPHTPAEVGIHLSYIRRDVLELKAQQGKDMQELKTSIADLGNHFVTMSDFESVKKTTDNNAVQLKLITTWKDNLSGRMVGFATGLSAASAGGAAVLTKIFGG